MNWPEFMVFFWIHQTEVIFLEDEVADEIEPVGKRFDYPEKIFRLSRFFRIIQIIPIFQELSRFFKDYPDFPENLSRKFSTLSRKIFPKSWIIQIFENPDISRFFEKSLYPDLKSR